MCNEIDSHCFRGWVFKEPTSMPCFKYHLDIPHLKKSQDTKITLAENKSIRGDFHITEKHSSGSFIWLHLCMNLKRDLEFSTDSWLPSGRGERVGWTESLELTDANYYI